MNSIKTVSFGNFPVSFQNNGYLNATVVAAHFNRRVGNYLKSERTQEYIAALAEKLSVTSKRATEDNQIVIIKQGGTEQGTWLHPKLAVDFARWLDPKFAVWCDEQIEQILSGSLTPRKALPSGLTHEQQEQVKALHRMLVGAVPREHQAKLAITLWSSIKSKFKVGYKDVPPEQFLEVLSLMSRVAVEKGVQYSEADTVNLETVPKLFANQANIPFNLNRNAYYAVTVRGGKIYRHLVSYITSPHEDSMIPCLAHQAV